MQYVSMVGDATMGHVQETVDEWRAAHGLPLLPVRMVSDTVYYSTREAIDVLYSYLDDTYCPMVEYHDETMRPCEPGVRELELDRRLESLRGRLAARNRPWWKEHQEQTAGMVECPECQSMLNVEYCGVRKGWHNHCPVCHADVRPRAVRDQFDRWNAEYLQLREERDRLRDRRKHPLCQLILLSTQDGVASNRIICG